jgi:hypothetical protein
MKQASKHPCLRKQNDRVFHTFSCYQKASLAWDPSATERAVELSDYREELAGGSFQTTTEKRYIQSMGYIRMGSTLGNERCCCFVRQRETAF